MLSRLVAVHEQHIGARLEWHRRAACGGVDFPVAMKRLRGTIALRSGLPQRFGFAFGQVPKIPGWFPPVTCGT
jgi:hypothetical protein